MIIHYAPIVHQFTSVLSRRGRKNIKLLKAFFQNISQFSLVNQQIKIIIPTMLKVHPLAALFKDQNFAWQLLENEIRIDLSNSPQAKDISQLLQLYMRGVEVMNTLVDPRESYFRNKVTALLAKNTVIKTLNNPKPEVIAPVKQSEKPTAGKVQKKKKLKLQKSAGLISSVGLQQKKKELQLRLAYTAQQHNPQGIKKLLEITQQSEIKITKKIQNIMRSHEEQLAERINRRKLRSVTCKSRNEDMNEAYQQMDQNNANGHDSRSGMPVFNTITEIIPESPSKNKDRRQYKSLQINKQSTRQRTNSVQLNFIGK